jgi:cbb3-type cytochrome oxidase subunit 1
MVVFLIALTTLVAVAVLFLAARNWYEFGVIAVFISLLYPWYTDASLAWWLGCGAVAILLTAVFINRSRLAPVLVNFWHFLSTPYPGKTRRTDKWV